MINGESVCVPVLIICSLPFWQFHTLAPIREHRDGLGMFDQSAHTHTHSDTHGAEPLALPTAGVISFPPAVCIKADVPQKHTHTHAFCLSAFVSFSKQMTQ